MSKVQDYLASGAMPDNLDEQDALMAAMFSSSSPGPAASGAEDPDPSAPAQGTVPAAAVQAQGAPAPAASPAPPAATPAAGETPPAGVAAKDGQAIIPFEVLEATRRDHQAALARANTAEQALSEWQRLYGRPTTPEPATAPGEGPTERAEVAAALLESMRETWPEAADLFEQQAQEIGELKGVVRQVWTIEQQRLAQAQADVDAAVQTAIDTDPRLSYWQSQDKPAWAFANEIFQAMEHDPKVAGLPVAEQMAKVARAVEAVYGLPPAVTAAQAAKPNGNGHAPPPAAGQPASPSPLPASGLPAARTTPPVYSLSDLPGGSDAPIPNSGPNPNMSSAEIFETVRSMDDKAFMNYLQGRG